MPLAQRSLALPGFLVAFILLYFSIDPVLNDPDTPWHLAAGEWILSHRTLPLTDPWSYTSAGQRWYLLSWPWDVLIALIDRVFGLQGVYLFTVLCCAALVALLARQLEARSVGQDAQLLTLLLASLSLVDFAYARPQLAGYAMILAFQGILHKSRAESHFKSLYWLPMLMLVWLNIHGSFLIGYCMLGAYGADALFRKQYSHLKRILVIALLCATVFPLNPYGFGLIHGLRATLSSSLTPYIAEWKPFTFGQAIGISAWLLAFLFSSLMRSPRVTLADWLLSLLGLTLMLSSARHAPLFLFLSAPALGLNLDAAATRFPPRAPLSLPSHLPALTMLTLTLAAWHSSIFHPARHIVSPDKDLSGAVAYLMANHPNARLFNDYAAGGQLIYLSHGALSPFIDSRAGTAYPEGVLEEYIELFKNPDGWKRITEKYKMGAAIIPQNNQLMKQLVVDLSRQSEWMKLYVDNASVIYMKQ